MKKLFQIFLLVGIPSFVLAMEPNVSAGLGGSNFLKTALQAISGFLQADSFLESLKVFIPILLLGFLHAFQPGHGKSIFLSYLIDQTRSQKDVLKFSATLTITHLLDVIVLIVLVRIFSLWINTASFITTVQKIGAVGLFGVSIFILTQAVKNIYKKQNCSMSARTSNYLGIFAGLAPCTYGWAIFMTILGLGKVEWMLPIILVFGLGIFSALFIFGSLAMRIKTSLSNKIAIFARYSALISGLLLLFFSFQMFFWIYQ